MFGAFRNVNTITTAENYHQYLLTSDGEDGGTASARERESRRANRRLQRTGESEYALAEAIQLAAQASGSAPNVDSVTLAHAIARSLAQERARRTAATVAAGLDPSSDSDSAHDMSTPVERRAWRGDFVNAPAEFYTKPNAVGKVLAAAQQKRNAGRLPPATRRIRDLERRHRRALRTALIKANDAAAAAAAGGDDTGAAAAQKMKQRRMVDPEAYSAQLRPEDNDDDDDTNDDDEEEEQQQQQQQQQQQPESAAKPAAAGSSECSDFEVLSRPTLTANASVASLASVGSLAENVEADFQIVAAMAAATAGATTAAGAEAAASLDSHAYWESLSADARRSLNRAWASPFISELDRVLLLFKHGVAFTFAADAPAGPAPGGVAAAIDAWQRAGGNTGPLVLPTPATFVVASAGAAGRAALPIAAGEPLLLEFKDVYGRQLATGAAAFHCLDAATVARGAAKLLRVAPLSKAAAGNSIVVTGHCHELAPLLRRLAGKASK